MSSIAMLGAGALESLASNSTQSRVQKFKQDFQQLGQDLQAGNLAQAKSDLAGLQPGNAPASSSPGTVSQAFQQLTQDLQAGNLPGAQADYASLQQDLQPSAAASPHRHHDHIRGPNGPGAQQEFSQLGQALQSGNLSAAQAAYASLQADAGFAAFGTAGGSGAISATGATLNVAA
jgi:hypothetical protein